jgi:hypothetical protein
VQFLGVAQRVGLIIIFFSLIELKEGMKVLEVKFET